jgi:alginate O-acetyltransferase complex protein AlgJ
VPVPPKAALYPDKVLQGSESGRESSLATLAAFYAKLNEAGVEVIDLIPVFAKMRDSGNPSEAPYCKTDTHWSPAGCEAAATCIAEALGKKLGEAPAGKPFTTKEGGFDLEGDLLALLPAGTPKPGKEKLQLRRVVSEPAGKTLEADPANPVLLLGDSHTLVFHEFAGEGAGLLDHVALQRHSVPDLIGTRGSGATAVRISLYRKALKDPGYLAKKKVVVWCFTAREFTESDQGWPKLPISK